MPVYKGEKRGTYWVKMQIELPDGTRKQHKKTGFTSKGEAQEYEAKIKAGVLENASKLTFEAIASKYLNWYETRRKPASFAKVEPIIRKYLIPYFGKKKIERITTAEIIEWQDYMMKTKFEQRWGTKKILANDTLLAIHTRLSAIFNFGMKHHNLKMNPAAVVGNFELKPVKRLDFWEVHEFEKFYSAIDNTKYKIAFLLLFYGGIRKGELLGVQWKNVDNQKNEIFIEVSAGKFGVDDTKTEASERIVSIPESLMKLMIDYKEILPEAYKEDDCFVLGEIGTKPLSASQLDRMYDKYLKKSNVRKIHIHEFRHSHASYLINKKCTITVVAARLGHKDVAETLNTYAHLYPNSQDEAIKIIEQDIKI